MNDMRKKALRIVEKNRNVVVASIDEEGYPNMKIMFNTRDREEIKVFYFTTNTSSLRVSQFQKNPKACLYFADTRFFNGLMIKARWRSASTKIPGKKFGAVATRCITRTV